ncbi:rhodanese-like domain-containing protein [Candidatus Mycoplasma mahonii]|uniref:rhodanese-like domain-containing protein n=1 Tax=Candidatus Mycoplasma mahonii TaxID=3004105 RepID=UPI0026F0FD52|nr:rhodanese-like domain-containing protein [Candidatus Mycoplasma mahonii]WKX02783.1 rhodanese-like domain-containing protein [Candidatus Mycoplasma mahonii]
MKQVKIKWATKHVGEINLVDVRTPVEFKAKHIEGAKNIPLKEILKDGSNLFDKNKTYYFMCRSGGRSMVASKTLEEQGLDVVNCEYETRSLDDKK